MRCYYIGRGVLGGRCSRRMLARTRGLTYAEGMSNKTAPQVSAKGALLLAALLVLGLSRFVPYGRLVLYPFTLLATWVHEMGHGLTALLCGGKFAQLEIFSNASGLASTAVVPGFRQALVCAGGLLGPPFWGAVLLILSRRAARPVLFALSLALLLSLPLWVRTAVGWVTVGGLAGLCMLVARFASAGGRVFFAQLLGLLLALDTVTRADYLFMGSAQVGGQVRPSDVGAIAQVMGGPYQLWCGLLAVISGLLLLCGLYSVLRTGKTSAPEAAASVLPELS
jgi:Peptidase M50B-like